MRIGIIILVISCASAAQTAKRVSGDYSNPALGYEVTVPEGFAGKTGDQAGPERGFTVTLPSGGTIAVYGEPNSLEWKLRLTVYGIPLVSRNVTPIAGREPALGVGVDSRRQKALSRVTIEC